MADVEKSDPDNGNPWSNPSGGYNPWNTDTYAKGSFGAPNGNNGNGGNPTGTISVSEVLQTSDSTKVTVVGVVKDELNTKYGVLVADTQDPQKTIAVKLPAQYRDQYSPYLNPSILGTQITITGIVGSYMGVKGISSVESIK